MNETVVLILLIFSCMLSITCIILLIVFRGHTLSRRDLNQMQQNIFAELRASRGESNSVQLNAMRALGESQSSALQQSSYHQDQRLRSIQTAMTEQLALIERRLNNFSQQSEQKLENIRATMENRITALQQENTKSLEQMRQTVDEKLQHTLDEKLQRSFESVSNQLEQVYKGLGEMQTLANGVGDLKKVLSNVKTRGILGEIQLGSILEEILSPEQYAKNIVTRPGQNEPVEFAIRLPGDEETPVWLPVDAKFPMDLYVHLTEAYDAGDTDAIEQSGKLLEQRMRTCARDIHEKYIEPPYTTEFAVLFLPTEGLYAEVMRRGLMERLQREFKVSIAGPSTMAALLNSLQMGFQTLAIQKRSGEVWKVLSGIKAEFDTFAEALVSAQSRIKQADSELDKLLGVRTRQMQCKLNRLQSLEGTADAAALNVPVIPLSAADTDSTDMY